MDGPGGFFYTRPTKTETARETPWPVANELKQEKRWGLILHDLEVKGSSFCKLTVKETIDGERAMVTWFGRYLATVRVASGEALVLVTAPAVAALMGGPLPSNNSAREVSIHQVDGASLRGNGG
jgi:hypothetical protein